jgi:hypothetical protein
MVMGLRILENTEESKCRKSMISGYLLPVFLGWCRFVPCQYPHSTVGRVIADAGWKIRCEYMQCDNMILYRFKIY